MSNYFDNQAKWAWNVRDGKATILTDHGSHTHTLDFTDITVGEMSDPKTMGKVMGNAHRAASHDPVTSHKEDKMSKNSFLESLKVDQETLDKLNEVSRNYRAEPKVERKANEGGRERGDDGPSGHSRESGYKTGPAEQAANGKGNNNPTAKGGLSSGNGLGGNGGGLGGSGGVSGGHGGGGGGGGHGGGGGGGGGGGHGGSGGGHGGGGGGHGGGGGGHGGGGGSGGGGHGGSGGGHGR